MYFFHFPKWFRWFYPSAVWDFFSDPTPPKKIYLTFDDGPNPFTTEWILDLLNRYEAKATFFCLGKQVANNPDLYRQIQYNGHAVGNHSYSHINGWKTKTENYIEDVKKASKFIQSSLYRPPYGRITPKQFKILKKEGFTPIFWSHLTYDFDANLSPEKRLRKMKKACKNGAILVFHDSDKALNQLKRELPELLETLRSNGYDICSIDQIVKPL